MKELLSNDSDAKVTKTSKTGAQENKIKYNTVPSFCWRSLESKLGHTCRLAGDGLTPLLAGRRSHRQFDEPATLR